MTSLIVFIVIILLIAVFAVSIYNKLVTLRNRFKNSFAQIEVQLKRRYDLIPNLVSTANEGVKSKLTKLLFLRESQ